MHKIGIVAIFVLLKIEKKGEIDISGIIFNLVYFHKFKFILLATVYKLFTLEVIQKCQ